MVEELKANRRWEAKNPDKTKHDTARRQAKGYIKNWATPEDLTELSSWIDKKKNGEEIK